MEKCKIAIMIFYDYDDDKAVNSADSGVFSRVTL